MGHKICFDGEIWLIIPELSLSPLFIWSTVKILQAAVCARSTGKLLRRSKPSRKSVVRLTDHPNMTLAVYSGCKTITHNIKM